MPRQRAASYELPPRPRRGNPEETRARLIAAAADAFNEVGYEGTDSNRIARAAGYAPGTFYKHFDDKKEIFLAVYAEWVSREWRSIAATLSEPFALREQARRVVEVFLAHHLRWAGFRASLRALVAVDEEIRAFYRAQRRRQLELLAGLRGRAGKRAVPREEQALLLFTIERAADSLADGEAVSLGLRPAVVRQLLVDLVAEHLDPA